MDVHINTISIDFLNNLGCFFVKCLLHFWLDSVIALYSISKSSSNWKPFVSNRVQEIHGSYEKSLWHSIKGSENPADLVT